MPTDLTFAELRKANADRCTYFGHTIEEWSLTDWMTAVAGEVGELAGEIKGLRKIDGPLGSVIEAVVVNRRMAHEAADIVIYLDLLCARAGIDLGEAVREKFNLVSRERLEDCDIVL